MLCVSGVAGAENFSSAFTSFVDRRRMRACLSGILAATLGTTAVCGSAQTAHFLAAQISIQSSALNGAQGVAVDSSGAIYIANSGQSTVLKETPSNGTYTESTIGSGFNFPAAIAVDQFGTVYIADQGNDRVVKETPSGGTSYIQSTVGEGFSSPGGVAVDSNGNVYVAETGDNVVDKELLSGGNYTRYIVATGSAGSAYTGVAVDGAGNVYVTDSNNHEVLKEVVTGGTYAQSIIATGIFGAAGVLVDGNGNVFVADQGTAGAGRILEEMPSGGGYTQSTIYEGAIGTYGIAEDQNGTFYFSNVDAPYAYRLQLGSVLNFGSAAVGSVNSTALLIFAFDSEGSISTPAVSTQGVSKRDFQDLIAGSCTVNGTGHIYSAGDLCTVDVGFSPTYSGARSGAAVIANNAGAVIATEYLQGTGTGPQIAFPPGKQAALSLANVTSPLAVASDGTGNLYVAQATAVNAPGNAVVKESWNGSSYTQTTVASGLSYPVGVAVDGAGDVYIADQGASTVYKETLSGGTYTESIVDTTLGNVSAVAVDGAGNVYAGRGGTGVEKETLSGGSYRGTEIYNASYVTGIAVDGAGDLYFATNGASPILKETPVTGGGYTQSSVGNLDATAVAVDGMGNVYGLSGSGGTVWSEKPSNGSYVQTTLASGLNDPLGIAVDGTENVYYSSAAAGIVWKLDNADPPSLNFATTAYGATSTDSPQAVTVANVGNAALDFSVPGIGTNPNPGTSFTLNPNAASACPIVDAGASSGSNLAGGATCELAISFTPLLGGPISQSVVLTDNALNASGPFYTTQTIALNGAGTHGPAPITWANPAAIYYGAALSGTQLNATAPTPGTFIYSPAAGTVLGVGVYTLTTAFTPTDTFDYIPTTATVSFTVARATPAISWATPAAVPYGTVLGAAQLNATTPVAGTFSYSPAAGTVPDVGTQTLSVTFTPNDSTDYAPATATVSLVVNQGTPTNTLTSSAASAFVGNAVTFTSALASNGATPAGSVSFYDGKTYLAVASLKNGTAAYTTSTLTVGTHSITAVYTGSSDFAAVTSTAVSEVIEDFTLGAASGGSMSATGSPGGQATYTLALTPSNGQTLPAPITFQVTGLPAGATATFSPASIAAGAGATNVTLTIQLPSSAKTSPASEFFGGGGMTIALGLVLLPFFGRSKQSSPGRGWMLVTVIGTSLLFASLAGCSGGKSSSSSSGSGNSGSGGSGGTTTQAQTDTLFLTATSGSLSHETTLTLTVE